MTGSRGTGNITPRTRSIKKEEASSAAHRGGERREDGHAEFDPS